MKLAYAAGLVAAGVLGLLGYALGYNHGHRDGWHGAQRWCD